MRLLLPTLLSSFLVCFDVLLVVGVAAEQQHGGGFRRQVRAVVEQEHDDDNDDCMEVFQQLDVDNNGYLTKSDLATILAGEGLSQGYVDNYLLEVNNDATVDMATYCKREKKKQRHKKQKQMSKIHQIALSKEQAAEKKAAIWAKILNKEKISNSDCEAVFYSLDPSDDGYVTSGDINDLDRYGVSSDCIDDALDEYASSDGIRMTRDQFRDEFCSGGNRQNRNRQSNNNRASNGRFSGDDCEQVFYSLDPSDDGYVTSGDIRDLENYGIDSDSIDDVLDEYASDDGIQMTLEEFQDEFCD